jgi:hypothetical protein
VLRSLIQEFFKRLFSTHTCPSLPRLKNGKKEF